MARLFDKIIKATCDIMVQDNDLAAAIKTLEKHKLGRDLEVTDAGKYDPSQNEHNIKFRTTCFKWNNVVNDLIKTCKSKVTTAVTDQFGKVHYIELA